MRESGASGQTGPYLPTQMILGKALLWAGEGLHGAARY